MFEEGSSINWAGGDVDADDDEQWTADRKAAVGVQKLARWVSLLRRSGRQDCARLADADGARTPR